MTRPNTGCLVCTLKNLDTRLSSASNNILKPRQLKLIRSQFNLLTQRLKNADKRVIPCCPIHKDMLALLRKRFFVLSRKKSLERNKQFTDAHQLLLELKQELRISRLQDPGGDTKDLRIRIFQVQCLVSQRRRRLKDAHAKSVQTKDLAEQVRELLRSNDEEKAAGTDEHTEN